MQSHSFPDLPDDLASLSKVILCGTLALSVSNVWGSHSIGLFCNKSTVCPYSRLPWSKFVPLPAMFLDTCNYIFYGQWIPAITYCVRPFKINCAVWVPIFPKGTREGGKKNTCWKLHYIFGLLCVFRKT